MSVAARMRRPRAPPFIDPPGYTRHRPEATLLYQLVEQHYPAFRELRAEAGRPLPEFIQEEFEAYLKCGRLEESFLRVRCEQCHAEKLVAFSCKKRGFCPSCGARRMAETAALLANADAGFSGPLQDPVEPWYYDFRPEQDRAFAVAACGR